MAGPRNEQLSHDPEAASEASETRAPARKLWQSPRLRRLGTLEELVLGGGKAGTLVDGDPRSTRKRGTG